MERLTRDSSAQLRMEGSRVPGPQRVRLDALREARGELGGKAVILLGLQRHI